MRTIDVAGVWPVLATSFDPAGAADEGGLRAVVEYAVRAGIDGVVHPGVAASTNRCDPPSASGS